MFSDVFRGGREREQWHKMDWLLKVGTKQELQLKAQQNSFWKPTVQLTNFQCIVGNIKHKN